MRQLAGVWYVVRASSAARRGAARRGNRPLSRVQRSICAVQEHAANFHLRIRVDGALVFSAPFKECAARPPARRSIAARAA
jgi:hypothetical protein